MPWSKLALAPLVSASVAVGVWAKPGAHSSDTNRKQRRNRKGLIDIRHNLAVCMEGGADASGMVRAPPTSRHQKRALARRPAVESLGRCVSLASEGGPLQLDPDLIPAQERQRRRRIIAGELGIALAPQAR